jgi:hypothetical protein
MRYRPSSSPKNKHRELPLEVREKRRRLAKQRRNLVERYSFSFHGLTKEEQTVEIS